VARLSLPATKGNLLKVRDSLALAAEALTFLEEKRDILLGELCRLEARASATRRRMERALEEGYRHLRAGLLAVGAEGVARAALGVAEDGGIVLSDRPFLGMPMPVVEFRPGRQRPEFSFGGTVGALDECHLAIGDTLALIAELAEMEAVMWQLAEELKRTVRRTNALSYVLIPTYRETIRYLEGSLEERERESLFHLKRGKARRARGD